MNRSHFDLTPEAVARSAPTFPGRLLQDPSVLEGLGHADILDSRGMPPPDGLEVAVFGIGTAKSRTTWLARCLDEHPGVHVSQPKEPHFFSPRRYPYDTRANDRFLFDWSWYADRYDAAAAGLLRADFSNTTINDGAVTAPLIKTLYPDARFVVCLRDPVTRTYSHYWNTVREPQVQNVPESFDAALAHGEILRRSRYHDLLVPWFQTFPRRRFLIHFDFEMDRDPERVVRETFRFIGADPDFEPSAVRSRVNAPSRSSGRLRKARRAAARLNASGLAPLVTVAKRLGAERVLARTERRPVAYPPLSAERAQRLYEDLAPSINDLERLLGRDLSPWRRWEDPAPLG